MNKPFLLAGAAAMAMTSYAVPAFAQDTDGEPEARQNVIVITGRKKEETLLDAPISVTAFSGEDLADYGAISSRDIADLTPGLQINGDFGRTGERPVIRGISNLRAETPQPVGLFIDGVYVRTGLISEVLDNVERVEVLKGPQGALYGRSTYGGVLNYISKTPSDTFEANISATYAEHDQAELTGRISGPVADGFNATIGARLYQYGGEYDNLNANTNGARDVGEEETTAVYGAINFKPPQTPQLEGNFRAYYSKDEDGQFAGQLFDSTFNNSVAGGGTECPQVIRSYFCGEASVPNNVNIATSLDAGSATGVIGLPPFFNTTAQWDFRAGLDREIQRISGDLTYDFNDNLSLTYMGGLTSEETHNVVNQSYSPTIVGNSFGTFPSAWITDDMAERDYYSHELRLNGSLNDNVDWILGAFVYDEETSGIDRNILEADYAFDGETSNEEKALYGAIDFALTDAFSVGFEGRYYEEDVGVTTASGSDLAATFDGFTWRATAEYQFANDVLLYGNVATGNKAGGFNTGVDPTDPVQAPFSSFDEETATQYELGMKGQFLDGDLRLTGALYRIELEDQQISQVVQLPNGQGGFDQITVVLNAGATEINGFEVDAQYDVTDNLLLAGSWSTSDGEFTEGSDPTQATILPSDTIVGFSVPRVSKNSGVASATYTFGELAGWEPAFRFDALYASSRYAQVQNLIETGDSTKANARLSFTNADHGTELTFWGRNIFDDDTPSNVFRYVDPGNFRFFARAHVAFLPRGQQLGVTLRKTF